MKLNLIFAFITLLSLPAFSQEQVAPTFENCQHIEANGDMQVCFNRTLMEHVVTSLKYPAGLEEEGKVFVEITFNENGQLQEPKVMRSFSELASNEAVKVLSTLPQVVRPATENGSPVAITYTVPVQFKK